MEFDNDQALNEGWDLFEVDGRLQVQRIDCPSDHVGVLDYTEPKFKSDPDAIIHIALKAWQGSSYHYDALARIGTLVEVSQ